MTKVTIRVELSVSKEMSDFLLDEAHSKKMSFEALLLSYIQERMDLSRRTRKG